VVVLSTAFLRELAGDERAGEAPPDAALEADLAAACARGRAAHDSFALDDLTFVRRLGQAVRAGGGDPRALPALALEDLYLAGACLAGDATAIAVFNDRHGATIREAVESVVRGPDAGEVEQRLAGALLVGSASAPPRLASYAGKAPLERWLRVAAQRAALVWLRESRAEARARDGAAVEPVAAGQTHPEMAFLKERYRGDFERALAEAIERLPERERVLLRLHLVNGLSVEKVGKMFAVTQPTASRWLAAARETLLEDIKATLGTRLGASTEELASLAGMVASRLDLSLSLLLRPR
jgi:RNA polymerase sigma-70 factor (ECF subfamily)